MNNSIFIAMWVGHFKFTISELGIFRALISDPKTPGIEVFYVNFSEIRIRHFGVIIMLLENLMLPLRQSMHDTHSVIILNYHFTVKFVIILATIKLYYFNCHIETALYILKDISIPFHGVINGMKNYVS